MSEDKNSRQLKRRAELASQLGNYIQDCNLTQMEAARLLGVNQPRVNDLLRGRLYRFSVGALLEMMDRANIQVEIQVKFPPLP
jgi:predicted XRE-type DNA-binding protein